MYGARLNSANERAEKTRSTAANTNKPLIKTTILGKFGRSHLPAFYFPSPRIYNRYSSGSDGLRLSDCTAFGLKVVKFPAALSRHQVKKKKGGSGCFHPEIGLAYCLFTPAMNWSAAAIVSDAEVPATTTVLPTSFTTTVPASKVTSEPCSADAVTVLTAGPPTETTTPALGASASITTRLLLSAYGMETSTLAALSGWMTAARLVESTVHAGVPPGPRTEQLPAVASIALTFTVTPPNTLLSPTLRTNSSPPVETLVSASANVKLGLPILFATLKFASE